MGKESYSLKMSTLVLVLLTFTPVVFSLKQKSENGSSTSSQENKKNALNKAI